MRAPNSTPMVRSWTGWNLLSVNCSSKHDLPTPVSNRTEVAKPIAVSFNNERSRSVVLYGVKASKHSPVSPMMIYLKRYLQICFGQ